jgi:hypothetical protein
MREKRNVQAREFWSKNLKGRHRFGELGVDGWIVLNCVVDKYETKIRIDFY